MENNRKKISVSHVIIFGIIFFLIGFGLIGLYGSVKKAMWGKGDIVRRWTTCQYLRARVNPYPVALHILRQAFGSIDGTERMRLRETPIYSIPRNIPHKDVLLDYGPPEPVYPPSEILLQTVITGFLPKDSVVPVWTGINMIALFCLFFILVQRHSLSRERTLLSSFTILAILLIWTPTQITISHTQYSIVVLGLLLLAYHEMETGHHFRAGIFLSLSLIKPSLSLPFFIVPLVKRQWKVFSVVAGIQILSTLIFSLIVRSAPWVVISEWIKVAQYFTAGMYSLQEILNRMAWENTIIGNSIIIGFLATVTFLYWHRQSIDNKFLFDFMCFVSVLWTYHGNYDFVVLLPPFLQILEGSTDKNTGKGGYRWVVAFCLWLGGFVLLDLALWTPIYRGDYVAFRLIRWGGRLALLGMCAWSGTRLFDSFSFSIKSSTA